MTFTADRDDVWVYDPAATWEVGDELRQIRAELAKAAERLAAPLFEAYEANVELKQQTYAARRATSQFARPDSRRSRSQQSQLPTHGWTGHGIGHHEVIPKPRRCGYPGCEIDGTG